MEKSHYICTERFDWTAQFTQKVEETNRSSNSIFETVSTRVAGCVGILFISLAEAVVHASLTVGKTCTGILASPYNCIADTCFSEYSAPQYFEFSSALINLMLAIESIYTAAILPFVCLVNPSRADAYINSRTAKPQETVENRPGNDVDVNDEIEQLQQEIEELKGKLESSKTKGQLKVSGKEEQLQNANTNITTLKEENLLLTSKLQNLLNVDNTDLLNQIAKLEAQLKASKELNNQTEKQNNLSNSGVEPSPNGEMKRGAGRGKPNPEQIKRTEELKRNRELREAQKPQAQTKNNESPKKKINLISSSGAAMTPDMLLSVKLRSSSNLTQFQSQQNLTNSSQLGRSNGSNNLASSNSNSTIAMFQSGFENWDRFKDLSSDNEGNLEDYKKECNDVYNDIKKLDKDIFLEKHQDYLDKLTQSTNMNQLMKIQEDVDRIERWIEALENKTIWSATTVDFTVSMGVFGFNNAMNNLDSDQLQVIINYFNAYKTELEKLRKGSKLGVQIQENQQQKIENEEAKIKAQLDKLENRKLDLLRPLEFKFDEESNEKSLIWKTSFLEYKAFSNRQEFLDIRKKMIEVINSLKHVDQIDEKEYERMKGMVSFLNNAFEKAAKK